MKTEEIIPRVRVIINESASTCPDSFTVETDNALEQFILEAMSQIASMPGYDGQIAVQNNSESISFATRPDGLKYASIKANEDALRTISVWLEGWSYPVYEFLPASGTKFLAQYSSVPGIGSGKNAPVVFTTNDRDAKIIAHAVQKEGNYEVRYISKPQPDENGNILFPVKYSEALAYTAAGLYLQSIREYDSAKTAFDTSGSIIQTINLK